MASVTLAHRLGHLTPSSVANWAIACSACWWSAAPVISASARRAPACPLVAAQPSGWRSVDPATLGWVAGTTARSAAHRQGRRRRPPAPAPACPAGAAHPAAPPRPGRPRAAGRRPRQLLGPSVPTPMMSSGHRRSSASQTLQCTRRPTHRRRPDRPGYERLPLGLPLGRQPADYRPRHPRPRPPEAFQRRDEAPELIPGRDSSESTAATVARAAPRRQDRAGGPRFTPVLGSVGRSSTRGAATGTGQRQW